MESVVSVVKECAILKKTKEPCNVYLTKSAWIIYLLFLAQVRELATQRGGMTCPNRIAGVEITGRMERRLAVKQATYFTTHYLYDLGQITYLLSEARFNGLVWVKRLIRMRTDGLQPEV